VNRAALAPWHRQSGARQAADDEQIGRAGLGRGGQWERLRPLAMCRAAVLVVGCRTVAADHWMCSHRAGE